MARPLRKHKLDGTPYFRRDKVETEIQALAGISAAELERRADLWQVSDPGYVSPEALLYFVRNAAPGAYREAVRDHFVDLLLSDRNQYDDRLDYYEVNFNSAVAADRRDANDRHWKQENRTAEIETEDGGVSAQVESAVGHNNPFDADELDKKDYRLLLDEAIDSLPEFQRRIVVMWRQDIPIESNDPSVESISKVLGKSEKTVRTHRDKAFASLKLRLERKGKK